LENSPTKYKLVIHPLPSWKYATYIIDNSNARPNAILTIPLNKGKKAMPTTPISSKTTTTSPQQYHLYIASKADSQGYGIMGKNLYTFPALLVSFLIMYVFS